VEFEHCLLQDGLDVTFSTVDVWYSEEETLIGCQTARVHLWSRAPHTHTLLHHNPYCTIIDFLYSISYKDAHKALQSHVNLSLGRLSHPSWSRRPGRPRGRWIDQNIRNDTSQIPADSGDRPLDAVIVDE